MKLEEISSKYKVAVQATISEVFLQSTNDEVLNLKKITQLLAESLIGKINPGVKHQRNIRNATVDYFSEPFYVFDENGLKQFAQEVINQAKKELQEALTIR